ncbi:MAG: hypothetical protein LBQ23_02655, partial [Puniceicoccales bacterium]|nr:hypothetical protein [Puniceicoccales bacterium]
SNGFTRNFLLPFYQKKLKELVRMNVSELDFHGLKLLSADVSPSRYLFCPQDVARIISWQIVMADNSIRDVLFSEMDGEDSINDMGSKIFFNAKSMPLAGFDSLGIENLKFVKISDSKYDITFAPENDAISFLPKITYKLSELYFRLEISVTNRGTMPICWCPAIHFFINLPWINGTPLEKYIVKNLAKKRLRISDDMRIINSVKSSERTSLELLNNDIIGFTQLQDSKIWMGTPNEEEGLSFIFGNKTQKSVLMIRKTPTTGKIEVAFVSDMPSENGGNMTNADIQNYAMIAPNETDTFATEISAY